jgi:hypothetical protein
MTILEARCKYHIMCWSIVTLFNYVLWGLCLVYRRNTISWLQERLKNSNHLFNHHIHSWHSCWNEPYSSTGKWSKVILYLVTIKLAHACINFKFIANSLVRICELAFKWSGGMLWPLRRDLLSTFSEHETEDKWSWLSFTKAHGNTSHVRIDASNYVQLITTNSDLLFDDGIKILNSRTQL